jgi:hypothetical protein
VRANKYEVVKILSVKGGNLFVAKEIEITLDCKKLKPVYDKRN